MPTNDTWPELRFGLVEHPTDGTPCEQCGQQALVYLLDAAENQRFSCLGCLSKTTLVVIRDGGLHAVPNHCDPADDETIARLVQDGVTMFELDHLGIRRPDQAGTYAIYRDGDWVLEFASVHPAPKPGEPIPDDLLSLLFQEAINALIEDIRAEEASHA